MLDNQNIKIKETMYAINIYDYLFEIVTDLG